MRNEDTGEPIQCPHCGSEDQCPHLLAEIDRSFLECSAGYATDRFDEFHAKVEESFLKVLQSGKATRKEWDSEEPGWEELGELWGHAYAQYRATGEVEIDGHVLFRLIVQLLVEAGGEIYRGPIDAGGGPGSSSAITLFYAENPKDVVERALEDLDRCLGN